MDQKQIKLATTPAGESLQVGYVELDGGESKASSVLKRQLKR
jgi:hypothetical protein